MLLRGPLGEVLDEEIIEFRLVVVPLVLLLVNNDFNLLLVKFKPIHALLRSEGVLLVLELHVGEPTTGSVGIALELAGKDVAELSEEVEQFLLSHCLVHILHQYVRLLVKRLLVLLH